MAGDENLGSSLALRQERARGDKATRGGLCWIGRQSQSHCLGIPQAVYLFMWPSAVKLFKVWVSTYYEVVCVCLCAREWSLEV